MTGRAPSTVVGEQIGRGAPMFYHLSKILLFLLQPSSLAVLALLVGLVACRSERWARSGWRLAVVAAAYIAFAGFVPMGTALLLPLEERFGTLQPSFADVRVRGIIILGGFEDGWVSAGRGGLAVNEAAERLTEGVRLARQHPEAQVVFTGGVGDYLWGEDAAGPIAGYFADMGIAKERVRIEKMSRNTYENAVYSRALLRPQPQEKWLLVTSAYHMPRAVGTFRRAGFNVVAYPVDFRTRNRGDVLRIHERMPNGLERLDLAAKEWIGLAAYRLTGRTGEWFPGP